MAGIIPNPAPAAGDRASGAQVIDGSLTFNDDKGTYLQRNTATGNRRTWTWSGWVKQNILSTSAQVFVGGPDDADRTIIRLTSSNKLEVEEYSSGAYQFQYASEQLFRDPTGFMHICVNYDSTASVAVDRVRMYVNGLQITDFSTYNDADQGFASRINSETTHFIGRHAPSSTQYLDANLSQVYLIDGQALSPDIFGFRDPLTNTWRPRKFDKDPYTANDGRTWSGEGGSGIQGSSSWANLFNGTVPSNNSSYSDVVAVEGSGNTATVTFTPPISGKIRVRASSSASSGTINGSVSLSDGSSVSANVYPAAAAWKDFGYKHNISSLTLNAGSNGGTRVSAIEVDDVILTDDVVQRKSLRNPNDGTTWSNSASNTNLIYIGNIGKVFNGANLPWTTDNYASFNVGTLTLFSSQNIEVKSSIRIFGNWMSNDKIEINGTEYACDANGSQKWITPTGVTYPLTLNSLAIDTTPGNVQNSLSAVEIDGYTLIDGGVDNSFYLPMDGSAPIGENQFRTKTGPNDGSSYSTESRVVGSFAFSDTLATAFDGDTSTQCRADGVVTIHLPNPIPFSSSVTLTGSVDNGGGQIYVKDGTDSFVNVTDEDSGFPEGSGMETKNITSALSSPIKAIRLDSGSNAYARMGALTVDGTVIKDDTGAANWKPVNFGGSTSLDKATGALPILNTTQGGVHAAPGTRPVSEGFPGAEVNDGTIWSSLVDVSNATVNNGSAANMFDGSITTKINISGGYIEIDLSNRNVQAGSGGIEVYNNEGGAYTSYQVNGGEVINWQASAGWMSMGGANSKINTIRINHLSGGGVNAAFAFRVNDEILVDGNGLVLALPLLGNKEDVVASINSAQTNVTVTNNGSVPFQTTQSNFYGGSAFFEDSSSDNLTFTNFGSRFEFTGDYTIEAWIYPTDSGAADGSIFVENSGSDYFGFNFDPGTQFNIYNNSSSASWSPSTNLPPANKWSHIALVRSGSTQTIYVNGNSIATNTASGTHGYASPSFARIGGGASSGLDSYIQDLRVYKGVAKYTSNFIPASTNPDILPDTPSGISGKSELTKIIDGAVSFDGTGDYLQIADSADFELGSGDFTIEFYAYPKSLSSDSTVISKYSSSNKSYLVWMNSTTVYFTYSTNGSSNAASLSVTYSVPLNKWTHFAMARNGSTLNMFIDGVLVASPSISGTLYDGSSDLQIGRQEDGAQYYWNGFISNVRIIKGTALYTSRFTPPTAPLTNVTNTKLLCCQSNAQAGAAVTSPNMGGVNDGREWSHFTSASGGFNSSYPKYNLFDGNVTPRAEAASNDVPINIDFSPALTVSSTISIHSGKSSTSYQINNSGSYTTYSDAVDSYKDISFSGTLTNLKIKHGQSGQAAGANAIKIDGTVLTDAISVAGDTTATNFTPFNTDINTVRGQETGYATLNPLFPNPNGNTPTDGNLKQTTTSGNGQYNATMAIPQTGSWYWEVTKEGTDSTGIIGISTPELSLPSHNANNVGAFSWYIAGPRKQTNGVDSNYGGSVAQGDVVGVAYKSDIRELRFYLNGVDQGVAFDASSIGVAEYFPAFSAGSSSNTFTFSVNFGQKPFKFPPPDGYQLLNLASTRPEKVIGNAAQYVGVATYNGNGGTQDINYGFQPDLIFGKPRYAGTGGGWNWIDSVRGNKYLASQTGNGQQDFTGGNGVTFIKRGTRLVDLTGGDWNLNGDPGGTYVGSGGYVYYGFKAGGSESTFNVDGVGRSSAAEVGMNVGGQNSRAFDQSQTWSSNSASDSRGFDGSLAYDSNATRLYGTGTYHKVLNSTTYFENVTSLRIGTSENVGNVKIDGIVYTTTYLSAVGLTVTNPPTKFKEIEILGASGGVQLSYIMINGVILVDNGATPSVNYPTIASDACSVGTKNGFSIVQYEGNGTTNQSIAHGLDKKPDLVIIKNLSETYKWTIWQSELELSGDVVHNSPEYKMLSFDTSDETNFSEDCIWDVFDHTVKIHNSGSGNWVNKDGNDYIMYSWSNVPGLQKFGVYSGNGDADGPFVELGFRPAIVWTKNSQRTGYWYIYDGERSFYNPIGHKLELNDTSTEYTTITDWMDFTSTGFKIRRTGNDINPSNERMLYFAWAEAPASNLFGGQSNAR